MEKKQKYWILFTRHECPVCGGGDSYRERIYDRPKPEDARDRYIYEEMYDWCDAL